jgi:hypothetical protein
MAPSLPVGFVISIPPWSRPGTPPSVVPFGPFHPTLDETGSGGMRHPDPVRPAKPRPANPLPALPENHHRARTRSPENGLLFCKEHIEFTPHAIGQRIPCPHCAMAITLKAPHQYDIRPVATSYGDAAARQPAKMFLENVLFDVGCLGVWNVLFALPSE